MKNGTIKVGPITLALGLIIGGLGLLLYNFKSITSLDWLWKLWPVLLIGVGVEYFWRRKSTQSEEVRFHVPSILLILLLIIAGGVGYAATNMGSVLDRIIYEIPWYHNKLGYQRNWDAEPIIMEAGDQLVIQNKIGKIELSPAPEKELKVKAIIHGPENGPGRSLAEKLNPSVQREGNQVVIREPESEGPVNSSMVIDLEIAVPAGVEIQVESGTGRVLAQNMRQNLVINSNTGTIELRYIQGKIAVRNNTGRTEIYEPEGDVVAETNTGSMEVVSNRPLSGNYELKSNTGRVCLELPKDSDLVLEAESRTGRVSVSGLPDTKDETGPGDSYSYKLGSGKGRADLRVGTGAIEIKAR